MKIKAKKIDACKLYARRNSHGLDIVSISDIARAFNANSDYSTLADFICDNYIPIDSDTLDDLVEDGAIIPAAAVAIVNSTPKYEYDDYHATIKDTIALLFETPEEVLTYVICPAYGIVL